MIRLNNLTFAALFVVPGAAQAQTPPAPTTAPAPASATPTVGATIYDPAGVVVGTVEQITPQAVVVNLGTAKVGLPPASIGTGPRGLQVSITRAEVEAAAQQAQAGARQQLMAQLAPGATVQGSAGAVLGTVKTMDAQFVTLTTPRGDVKLPITGFGAGPNGAVLGMTAAQLDAAITAAGGAAPSATGDAAVDGEASAMPTAAASSAPKTTTRRPR